MGNYVICVEYLVRSPMSVKKRLVDIEIIDTSKHKARTGVVAKAIENRVECFKVISAIEYKCLSCRDTGTSLVDGCACCD